VPWFLETASRFNPNQVRFVMVGLVTLDKTRLEPFADRVQFVGAVPHSQVAEWLRKFDVFFFPSTCEGSAGAVLEAMSAGAAYHYDAQTAVHGFATASRVSSEATMTLAALSRPFASLTMIEICCCEWASRREPVFWHTTSTPIKATCCGSAREL